MTPTEHDKELEQSLDKLSELNKLGGRGHGDLADTCYVCGISPSKLLALITADRKRVELEARIQGIEEAHKEILSIVFTYTHHEEPNFCDVDDVSRVAMSWKVKRIAELKVQQGEV